MKVRTRIYVVCGLVACLGLAGLFALHRARIANLIQDAAVRMREYPYGSFIMFAIIVAASIPPMLGFTFFVTLAGFVYGMAGVVPAISGSFVGAVLAFNLIRHYNLGNRLLQLSSPSKQEKYRAIQEAVEDGGFRMLLLIRLCPIPWQMTNMLLSMLPSLKPSTFYLTAFFASFKVTLEVWMGSQLANLADPTLPPSAHRITLCTMGGGLILLCGVAFWLYRLTMKRVRAQEKQRDAFIASKV